jgi:hypothetical protein
MGLGGTAAAPEDHSKAEVLRWTLIRPHRDFFIGRFIQTPNKIIPRSMFGKEQINFCILRQGNNRSTVPSNKFGIRVGFDLYILSSNGW